MWSVSVEAKQGYMTRQGQNFGVTCRVAMINKDQTADRWVAGLGRGLVTNQHHCRAE